ncbi:unnamed protein product [Pedinophyceae sp. YPF-701]|nr:unnamed protein product [Pedinophyceae sp. YPF-701]
MTFAVKDLFDVQGEPTGNGNPTWLATHDAAASTAPAVEACLRAGAKMAGKTHMDELAYSLNGENVHYGTPVNPAAPGRVPGGSSSGSAAVTATGDVTFALGSDTAGSVRIPASYCGIWGFRPTWGRASLECARPLAQSFDTCGWFARDAATLAAVGGVLLPTGSPGRRPASLARWLVARDAFGGLCTQETAQAIYDGLQGDVGRGVREVLGDPQEVDLASGGGLGGPSEWFDVFRVLQAAEVWANHGEWIASAKPSFGPGVRERFEMASKITAEDVAGAKAKREQIVAHVDALIGADGVLALPTAPGPAPKIGLPAAELEVFRARALALTCTAGIAGLPQVSIPLAKVDGLPVGMSLIGPRGSDEDLLALCSRLFSDAST